MDAFTEIGVFVRVVDARGFTRAGQGLGLTASGVSRVVSRLEARLGVRLLDRTTRSLSLTDDGAAYYERCKVILADLEVEGLDRDYWVAWRHAEGLVSLCPLPSTELFQF